MKIYKVTLKQTEYFTVTLEAENRAQAAKLALETDSEEWDETGEITLDTTHIDETGQL